MVPDELFELFRTKALEHLRAALTTGEYVGWLVADPQNIDTVIAGAGVVLRSIPPFPRISATGNVSIADGQQALIVNVFTEPQWRRRGLARLLMEHALNWCGERKIESVTLHASEDGRALYEQLGFVPTTEMRLR